jgi:anti-sigma B factor antagonist
MNDNTDSHQADFLNVKIIDVLDGLLTARLDGELSYGTCEPALELLTDAISRGETRIILDLSRLGFCDSAGLRLLIQLHELTAKAGGWLRLAAPAPALQELIDLTNLHRILAIYPAVEDASAVKR